MREEQQTAAVDSSSAEASTAEQYALRWSTLVTVVVAVGGVGVGLLAGSMAIVFDGLFSFIDVAMALLTLWVARLVVQEGNRRFQFGYWHVEPMSLAFNGGMLIILCLYAFVNAVGSILEGGQEVAVGWALAYSALVSALSFLMVGFEARLNRSAESELVALDVRSWLMTGLAGLGLLAAFGTAFAIRNTSWAWLAPYIDPGVLAILSLALAVLPVRTVRRAVSEILLMTPSQLDETVRGAVDEIVARHGFTGYTSYAAKIGRGRFIEINIIVPPHRELGTVEDLDAIRAEIASALRGEGADQWLTIDFTGDERWT